MNCGSGGDLCAAAAGLGVERDLLRHLRHHRARRCLGSHRDLGVQLKRLRAGCLGLGLVVLDEEGAIDLSHIDGAVGSMELETLGVRVGARLGEGGLLLDVL